MTNEIETTAKETIKNLAELQDIDDELADIALERGNLPEELEKLAAKIAEFKTFITEKREELSTADKSATEDSGKLEVSKEQLAKYQQQLYSVKTTREYDAITTEIETTKKHIDEYEISIANNSSRKVELTSMLEERESELETLREQEKTIAAELKEKLAETEGEEAEIKKQRETVVSRIMVTIFTHYERIRDVKGGRGAVRLVTGACGGCFAVIPPQRQMEIRKAEDIHVCEACGRYLVPEGL